jgi:stage V sporulation protein D (sporulation-specific penicillin-binding protein)
MNAGLVQIGLRVAAPEFRRSLVELGYGRAPGTGLGIERAGYLAELPWVYRNTHASVCFGHEIATTLWQHAAALATVLRGGEYQPLSILHSVERGGLRYALPRVPPQRVFSERTCAEVRAMMELGAREGTGKDLWRDGLGMGTKTGTAEKVPSEVCLHVELAERQRREAAGIPMTAEAYRQLRSRPRPHRACYTASICMFGSLPGSDRQLMALVVVEEPRGKLKFGSKVAGPAAVAILTEALGLTRGGAQLEPELLAGFGTSRVVERNELEEPWRVLQ